MDTDTTTRLAYLAILLAALSGWLIVEFRQRTGQTLRMLAAWGLIFVGVMAGYGLWTDIRRDIHPSQIMSETKGVEVPRAEDGHYYLTLQINGVPLNFLVDTGASNMVLSKSDASRLGLDPASLRFFGEADTANGPVRTARVKLPLVELGPYRNENFTAYVNDGALFSSLLGMDYLGQFQVEISGNRMILHK